MIPQILTQIKNAFSPTSRSRRQRRNGWSNSAAAEVLECRQLLTAIGNGQEILTSLVRGGSQSFEFEAAAGSMIRVSVGETAAANNFDGEPNLQVIAPDGSLFGADNDGRDAAVQGTTLQGGTYRAIVRDSDNNDALSFRIRTVVLPEVSDLQFIQNRDQLLTNGEEVTSSVPIGSFNLYQFQAAAGSLIRVSVGETATANNFDAEPLLQIIAPDGSQIGTDDGGRDAELQGTVGQSGIYTVIVRDSDNNDALSFRIRTVVLPEVSDLQFIQNRDQLLTNGEEVTSSVPIGSFNLYQFQAAAGSLIRVSVGETATANNFDAEPLLQIIAPDGSLIGTDDDGRDAELQGTVEQSGIYTAIVRDNGNEEELSFRIRTVVLPEVSDLQFIQNRDQLLTNGEEVTSSVPIGGFNLYQFQAAAGSLIRVSVGETATANNFDAEPLLQIIAPDGSLIGTDDGGRDAELQGTVEQSGIYTAIVRDNGNEDELSFQIALIVELANRPPVINSAATAAVAENQTFAIDVNATDADGDVLTYSISGTDASRFHINSETGVVTFQTAPDSENPTDTGGNNVYEMTVTVTDGNSGSVSQDLAVTVTDVAEQLDEAPVLTSLSQALTRTRNTRLPVAWTSVSGADRYQVWYTRLADSATAFIDTFATSATFNPTVDLPIGLYEVRVRVNNANGITSPWSSAGRLHVNTPTVMQPADLQQAAFRPTLSWDELAGAVRYDLWVNNVTTGVSQVVRQTDVTSTSYSFTADLGPGLHRAWVRGIDAQGLPSAWSTAVSFNIEIAILGPGAATFSLAPTFSWSAAPNVTWEIYIRDASGSVVRQSGITSNSWTPTANLAAGPAVWWVRPTIGRRPGVWSQRQAVSIGAQTTVTSPIGDVRPPGRNSMAMPEFAWTAVEGAGSYDVYVRRLADNAVFRKIVGTQTAYAFDDAFAVGSYRVWVRAISATGTLGVWSRSVGFTVTSGR